MSHKKKLFHELLFDLQFTCHTCNVHDAVVCRYIYPVHSGVMCMDIHPQHSSLAVTGFYDGKRLLIEFHHPSLSLSLSPSFPSLLLSFPFSLSLFPLPLSFPHFQVQWQCIICKRRKRLLYSDRLQNLANTVIQSGRYTHTHT